MSKKQIAFSLILFSFAIYIPYITAYAQEATSTSSSAASVANTGLVSAPTPIEYQLPYPGMLPDNPLYFLKVFRDDITALFLSKPLDKANFYLLQSDKNVEASYILAAQQHPKIDLAFQTFAHAQSDFDQAITQATNAKKQGYSTQDLIPKLAQANQKHVQILQAIAQQSNQMNSQTVQDERSRAKTFAQRIKSIE